MCLKMKCCRDQPGGRRCPGGAERSAGRAAAWLGHESPALQRSLISDPAPPPTPELGGLGRSRGIADWASVCRLYGTHCHTFVFSLARLSV